jgi:hypothetical protein
LPERRTASLTSVTPSGSTQTGSRRALCE